MSQSYPKYYQAGLNCSWLVRVPPHQTVLTRLLDLQLGEAEDQAGSCLDHLEIDSSRLACGELGPSSQSLLVSAGPQALIRSDSLIGPHQSDTVLSLVNISQILSSHWSRSVRYSPLIG